MSILDLRLLGPAVIRHGGPVLKFRSQKAVALLAYLTVEGDLKSRAEIVALLWPESSEAKGRIVLRRTLAYLKDPLRERDEATTPHLLIERNTLGINRDSEIHTDLSVVQSAYEAARSIPRGDHLDAKDREGLLVRLEKAVAAYRGDFLAGFYIKDAADFDHWLDLERESWRRRMELIFDRLSHLQLESGDFLQGTATVERWVRHFRLNEAAHRRLMEARLLTGNRVGALEVYETYKAALENELGTEPGAEIENLAVRILTETTSRTPRVFVAPRRQQRPEPESPVLLDLPFVGRAEETMLLTSLYREALSGETRVMVLTGDAGNGKTRFVENFLDYAEAKGTDVLRGRSLGVGGGLPYGTLVTALRDRIERERAPDDLLPDTWLSELSRILPELKERYPDLRNPSPGEEIRAGLFEAMMLLVEALSRRAPVTLFLDDFHHADQDSRDALLYAASRWTERGCRVLVILGLRQGAFEENLSMLDWVRTLEREVSVSQLTLQNLSREDTAHLLRTLAAGGSADGADKAAVPPPEWFERWMYKETGGHTFCLLETLRELVKRGSIVLNEHPDGGWRLKVQAPGPGALKRFLPKGMTDLVQAQLARLDPATFDLLTASAVLGREFTFDQACAVADLNESQCLAALDEALRGQLLREKEAEPETAGGETYSFSHDKVRDVTYGELGSSRRRIFHRRAFEVLKNVPASPATLAYHASAGDLPEQAFYYEVSAGDQAIEATAVREGISRYEQARRLLNGASSGWNAGKVLLTPGSTNLHLNLGRAHEFVGEWEQARAVYEELREKARIAGEPALERSALLHLARLLVLRSYETEAAGEFLDKARDISAKEGETSSLEVIWNSILILSFKWAPEKALSWGHRALALARKVNKLEFIAHSQHTLTYALVLNGRWESAAVQATEASESYADLNQQRETPGTYLPWSYFTDILPSRKVAYRTMEAENLGILTVAEMHNGRLENAIDVIRRALEISFEVDNSGSIANNLAQLSVVLQEVGQYEEALRAAEQGIKRIQPRGLLQLIPRLVTLGKAQQHLMRLEEARESFLQVMDAVDVEKAPFLAMIPSHLCAGYALSGDWKNAHVYALQASAVRKKAAGYSLISDFVSNYETEALLRGDDEELARDGVRIIEACAAGNRRYRIPYLRAAATLARWDGQFEEAVEYLGEAGRIARNIGLPGEIWPIEADLGRLYRELGSEELAARAYTRAASVLEGLAGDIKEEGLRSQFLAARSVQETLENKPPAASGWRPGVGLGRPRWVSGKKSSSSK